MQVTNIFNYFSLPGQSFKPTTFRSMNLNYIGLLLMIASDVRPRFVWPDFSILYQKIIKL
jgi:hypothetical protein